MLNNPFEIFAISASNALFKWSSSLSRSLIAWLQACIGDDWLVVWILAIIFCSVVILASVYSWPAISAVEPWDAQSFNSIVVLGKNSSRFNPLTRWEKRTLLQGMNRNHDGELFRSLTLCTQQPPVRKVCLFFLFLTIVLGCSEKKRANGHSSGNLSGLHLNIWKCPTINSREFWANFGLIWVLIYGWI